MKIRSMLAVVGTLLAAPSAHAGFSYTGSAITENFNGLATTSSTATNLGTQSGQVVALSGTGFDAAKVDGTNTALTYYTDSGTSNAGAIHNYGADGSTDRALGSLASGSSTPAFGVVITNNSASALSSITLSFLSEQFRSSTSQQNSLTFAYGLSGGSSGATASNYLLSTVALTANSAFDIVGGPPVTTNGALNPPLVTAVAGTISVNVAVGQSIFLRWTDVDNTGNDAGLAIDNFRFTATPAAGGGGTTPPTVPEPASALMVGLGAIGLGAIARRRRAAR